MSVANYHWLSGALKSDWSEFGELSDFIISVAGSAHNPFQTTHIDYKQTS